MRSLKQTRSQNPAASGVLNLKGKPSSRTSATAMRRKHQFAEVSLLGKKITVMGINPEGRGVQDAEFLARHGAKVVATDTKNEKDLKESVARLKRYKNISFALGGHHPRDFKNKDLIIRAAGAPLNSIYLKEAKKNGIEIKTDETLFLKLAPKIILVGVTGTKGKSTVTHLIYEVLKQARRRVFLAGNVRGQAALPLLEKVNPVRSRARDSIASPFGTAGAATSNGVKDGDIVVMELDSWKLQGFRDAKISPRVAVFTNFYRDHLNYYKGDMKKYFSDKANIFKYQKNGDMLIAGKSAKDAIQKYYKGKVKSNIVETSKKYFPKSWHQLILGEHNKENIVFAVKACETLGISKKDIKKAVESFKGVPGRLEFVREINGVKYYNDTTATTPEAAIAALRALNSRNVILLAGGADKNLDYREFAKIIPKFAKTLILFKGEASDKLLHKLRNVCDCHSRESGNPARFDSKKIHKDVSSMKEAVRVAQKQAFRGDIILLSPAAASFGIFKNEFDRGEQFCELANQIRKVF